MLRPGSRATATTLYLSLAFAYGAVDFANDFWQEQIVKRNWSDWQFPSALEPRVKPIWVVILAITAATAFALRYEAQRDADYSQRFPTRSGLGFLDRIADLLGGSNVVGRSEGARL